uniref:Uncharacterized protein n=1 Tax=Magnetococcus massalia (strain MO-1) TaxID=451514 RepID=A0A1S7LHK8_MAGMO|nr:Protein of unknown function [Candidatus Magnetococcus massalia]
MKKRTRKLPERAPDPQDDATLGIMPTPLPTGTAPEPEPEPEVIHRPPAALQLQLLLTEPLTLTPELLQQALGQSLPAQLFKVEKAAGGVITLRCFGRLYRLSCHAQGVAKERFEHVLMLGPGGEVLQQVIDTHPAHWDLLQLEGGQGSGMGEALMGSMQLMHLSAFLCQGLEGKVHPHGVLWNTSDMVTGWGHFLELVNDTFVGMKKQKVGDESAAEHLPANLWVGLHAQDKTEGGWCRTQGLEQFTGYELEMTIPNWDYQQVAAYLMMAVRYLYQNGQIRVGEYVGLSEELVKYFMMQPRKSSPDEAKLFAMEPSPAGQTGAGGR